MCYLPALGGVMVLGVAMAYCWLNASGHTALELRDGWVVFGPLMLIGCGLLVRGERRAGWGTVLVGLLGCGFGYFVHHLGIMQEYNFWAKNGLQAKNPHAALWLLGYGTGVVVTLGVATLGWRDRRGNETGVRVVAI